MAAFFCLRESDGDAHRHTLPLQMDKANMFNVKTGAPADCRLFTVYLNIKLTQQSWNCRAFGKTKKWFSSNILTNVFLLVLLNASGLENVIKFGAIFEYKGKRPCYVFGSQNHFPRESLLIFIHKEVWHSMAGHHGSRSNTFTCQQPSHWRTIPMGRYGLIPECRRKIALDILGQSNKDIRGSQVHNVPCSCPFVNQP